MCENCNLADQLWQKENQIETLKKDSFHGGFMTRELPNNIFPRMGQGTYAYRPYPIYGGMDIHTKIADRVTAAEYAKLSSVNVNSPKEDIVDFVNILQRLIAQGVFDPEKIEPDKSVQYNSINPFGGYSIPAPAPSAWGGFAGIQPLYGAPVPADFVNNNTSETIKIDATEPKKKGRKKKEAEKADANVLGNAILDSIFGVAPKSDNEDVSLSNYLDFNLEGDNK